MVALDADAVSFSGFGSFQLWLGSQDSRIPNKGLGWDSRAHGGDEPASWVGLVNEAMTNRRIWELYGNCSDSTLEMVSNCANLQHKSSTRSKGKKESSRSFGFLGG